MSTRAAKLRRSGCHHGHEGPAYERRARLAAAAAAAAAEHPKHRLAVPLLLLLWLPGGQKQGEKAPGAASLA